MTDETVMHCAKIPHHNPIKLKNVNLNSPQTTGLKDTSLFNVKLHVLNFINIFTT